MRVLSLLSGERGYCSLVADGDGARALRLGEGEALTAAAKEPIAEGRARLESDRGPLEVSWSPAGPAIELGFDGTTVMVHGVAASGEDPSNGAMSGPGVIWELPDEGWTLARTAWAVTAGSRLTVLVALRPEGVTEHGEELVGAARIDPREEPLGYLEPLLSTEYDGDGAHTRATLELWEEGAELAERGAGRRIAGAGIDVFRGRLEAARFAWGFRGEPAAGGYEILTL
ncbi:MAG TPA: hypothetical protein VFH44_09225 [Solirubrobacterales bacterium]|nr:hypothetical protein [Solirubrobacterales bacterium]